MSIPVRPLVLSAARLASRPASPLPRGSSAAECEYAPAHLAVGAVECVRFDSP